MIVNFIKKTFFSSIMRLFPILFTRNSSNTENKAYNAENAFQKIGID